MFTEHGCFHVELRGNILFLEIEGAWNIETALAFQKVISETIKPVIGKTWATITLMSNWELCTPDSETVIVNITIDAITKGLVREAVVNNSGSIKLELFEKYRNVTPPGDSKISFKRHIYNDEETALEWLASAGFGVDEVPS
jgi:hypothetical protein